MKYKYLNYFSLFGWESWGILCFALKGIIQGTVPYLGTFLTDLMMLDTALPDITEVRKLTANKAVLLLSVANLNSLWQIATEGTVYCKSYTNPSWVFSFQACL